MQSTISDVRLQTGETAKSTGVSRSRRGEDAAQITDPFMLMIMNLISQNSGDTQGAERTGLEGESTGGIEQLLASLGSQNSDGAAQLMQLLQGAELSSTNGAAQLMQLFGARATGLESTVLDQMGSSAYWQLFENVLESAQNSGKAPDVDAILQLLGSDASKLSDTTQLTDATAQLPQNLMQLLSAKDGAANQSTNVQQLIAELQKLAENGRITVTAQETGTETDAQNHKDMFGTAVTKAKELLAKQSAKTEAEPQAVQTQPEARAVTPFELRFKSAESVSETPLTEQIDTGIKKNLALGKTEFTVKLSPENLGEITVKLIEEAGKTTLTITTASAQTAKLINSDMDALKAAVAPMNVQVNEAVTQSEASQQGAMQQFDMAGQFSGQQYASQQFASQQSFLQMTRGYRDSESESYSPELTAAAAMSMVSTGRLDAYI